MTCHFNLESYGTTTRNNHSMFSRLFGWPELWNQGCLPENKLSALRVRIDIDVSSEKFQKLKIRQDHWDFLFFPLMEMSVLLSVVTLFSLGIRNTILKDAFRSWSWVFDYPTLTSSLWTDAIFCCTWKRPMWQGWQIQYKRPR